MAELAARRFVEERGTPRSLSAVRDAHKELRAACNRDDALRHASRLPRGDYNWLKIWSEEFVPAEIYCRHLGYDENTLLQLTPVGTRGADVIVTFNGQIERLEITIAQAAMHELWELPGSTSPGAQEALRSEMLNKQGYVSRDDPLIRNKHTSEVEYEGEEIARSSEAHIPEWAKGLGLVLRKKRDKQLADPSYGRESILAVYADGLSGDFTEPPSKVTISDVLAHLNAEDLPAGFVRTAVFGWHSGWFARL